MPRARVFAAWVPISAVLLSAWPAAAFHTVFDYAVERFEADGNAFGPADGVPDFVDEFDDGALALHWALAQGTAEETGGALHLKNPGSHVDVGYTVDVSEVINRTTLVDGDGDFTISSTWATIPAPADFIHMSLLMTSGPFYADTAFLNLIARNNGGGSLNIEQSYGKGYAISDQESTQVSVDAASAGLIFRIAVDDDTNLATLSFSLDGGASFMTPFTPHVVFDGSTQAIVLLGADPRAPMPCCVDADCTTRADADADGVCDADDNCPSVANFAQLDSDRDGSGDACDPCISNPGFKWKSLHLELVGINDDVLGNETIRLSAAFTLGTDAAPVDPAATGVEVTLWNGRREVDDPMVVAVPAGMKGASDAGWTVDETGRFVYEGGAARVGGVRRAMVKQRKNGVVAVKLVAPKGAFQSHTSPEPEHVAVAFGLAPGACAKKHYFQCYGHGRRRQLVCGKLY
jgi:hypothetical protein